MNCFGQGIWPERLPEQCFVADVFLEPRHVGIGLGCLGEASNAMVVRRRCVLAMGCIMTLFAISTGAWGLLFKNTISDVGASIWSMIKFRDPPLPALASVIELRR